MLIIFDFDGTICDSLDAYLKVANEELGTNFTKAQIRAKGTKQLAKEFGLSKIKMVRYILRARRKIKVLIPKLHTFKGLPQVLDKLRKNNELAIVTSNSKDNVKIFLEKEGMLDYFSEIDDSISYFGKDKKIRKVIKKLKYDADECVYIGDETRDIEAAKKAGIKSVAVTWGDENKSLLAKSRPEHIINTSKELLYIVYGKNRIRKQHTSRSAKRN